MHVHLRKGGAVRWILQRLRAKGFARADRRAIAEAALRDLRRVAPCGRAATADTDAFWRGTVDVSHRRPH